MYLPTHLTRRGRANPSFETLKRLFSYRCAWCDRGVNLALSSTRLTKDHVIPRSRGQHHLTIPACHDCNSRRGAQHPLTFVLAQGFVLRAVTARWVVPILEKAGWIE